MMVQASCGRQPNRFAFAAFWITVVPRLRRFAAYLSGRAFGLARVNGPLGW